MGRKATDLFERQPGCLERGNSAFFVLKPNERRFWPKGTEPRGLNKFYNLTNTLCEKRRCLRHKKTGK